MKTLTEKREKKVTIRDIYISHIFNFAFERIQGGTERADYL